MCGAGWENGVYSVNISGKDSERLSIIDITVEISILT